MSQTKKDYKMLKDFQQLTIENFGLKTILTKNEVIIFPYSVDEIGNPKHNEYRIDVNYFDNKFWFNYLHLTMICESNLEQSQYYLFESIKQIMNKSGIIKELLPETRYKNKQNEQQ